MGLGLAAVAARVTGAEPGAVFWAGAVVASGLPDLDTLPSLFGRPCTRIHRGPSHSLPFILMVVILGWLVFTRLNLPLVWLAAWSAALLSHPLLDFITTDQTLAGSGFGLMLFWPFSRKRWFVSRRLFDTFEVRRSTSLFHAWKLMLPELMWVGIPAAVALGLLNWG